jgi:hypothetical protein
MSDRSVFTDEEWRHVTDAPTLIYLTVAAAGHHGPISMFKESMASAKAIAKPGERHSADSLVHAIAAEATGKGARHDARAHKGSSVDEIIRLGLDDLEPAAQALKAKLPADEAAEVGGWFNDVARAVGAATKDVTPREQAVLGQIEALFTGAG